MASPFSLDALASKLSFRKQEFSEEVASEIIKLFKLSVRSTAALTLTLAAVDACFIAKGLIQPSERLITEKVLLAIIGASLVQVGAATAAIVYSLFRRGSSDAISTDDDSTVPGEA